MRHTTTARSNLFRTNTEQRTYKTPVRKINFSKTSHFEVDENFPDIFEQTEKREDKQMTEMGILTENIQNKILFILSIIDSYNIDFIEDSLDITPPVTIFLIYIMCLMYKANLAMSFFYVYFIISTFSIWVLINLVYTSNDKKNKNDKKVSNK